METGILFVFKRLDPGGAELRTWEVVQAHGGRFEFLAVGGGRGLLDERLESAGHVIHYVGRNLAGLMNVYVLLRKRRIRVLHAQVGAASGYLIAIARIAGVPTRIANFRSDLVGGRARVAKSLYIALSRALIRLFATDLIGVSPGALRGWSRRWQADRRCIVIPNGVVVSKLLESAGRADPRRDWRTTVVSVGRDEQAKNRMRSIEVWSALAAETPSRLFLVGSLSEDERSAGEAAGRTHSSSEVVLTGRIEDVAPVIAQADVLLLTSQREGLPGVVLEALALGTPVVATALPGVRWIAEHVPGVVMLELDQPDEAWANAIRRATQLDREEIRRAFDVGPFTVESSLTLFQEIWTRSRTPSVLGNSSDSTS